MISLNKEQTEYQALNERWLQTSGQAGRLFSYICRLCKYETEPVTHTACQHCRLNPSSYPGFSLANRGALAKKIESRQYLFLQTMPVSKLLVLLAFVKEEAE